jgi:hypothetical protein
MEVKGQLHTPTFHILGEVISGTLGYKDNGLQSLSGRGGEENPLPMPDILPH